MEQRVKDGSFSGAELGFASAVKAAIVCAIAVGVLLIAAMTQGEGPVTKGAIAATKGEDTRQDIYFPAKFPAPTGAPERHIEAF